MAGSTGQNALNLMLIGRTGEGKSATGNTILGHVVFEESCTSSSVTKDVASKFVLFDNFKVKVVDCPGIMDTDMDSGEDKRTAAENMAEALGKCDGGVDAFILVIRRGRFTDESRKSLDALKKIFGDRYMQNLIVVVTFGDQFKNDMKREKLGNISFKDWCSQQKGSFKQLFDDFSDRFLQINNREEDRHKNETQRREIIRLADSLRKQKGRYTSSSFQEAKAARDKLIVQENLPMLNESLQMKVGLFADYIFKLEEAPSDREQESILKSLNDLKNEITEKDKGTGLLKHLMDKAEQVKTALHDLDKLHCLAKEMEDIREEKSGWSLYRMVTTGLKTIAGIGSIVAVAALALVTAPVSLTLAAASSVVLGTSYLLGQVVTGKCNQELQELSTSEKQKQDEQIALKMKMTKDKLNKDGFPHK